MPDPVEPVVEPTEVVEETSSTDSSAELEAAVEQRLAAAFPDDDEPVESELDDDPAPVAEETPAEEVAEDDTPAEEPAEDPAEGVEEPVEEPVEEAAGPTDSPTLPAAMRRSAKARGWEDGEIDEFVKTSPNLALRTFDRIHQSRVNELAEWAKLGREVQKPAAEAEPEVRKTATPAQAALPETFDLIDEEKLIGQYGNEEIVKAIAAPVNKALAQVNEILPYLREGQAAVKQAERDATWQAINGFLSSADMAPYVKVYGVKNATRTPEQIENLKKLLEEADARLVGAAAQGRELAADEALSFAHEAVASKFKEQIIRSSLKKTAKKRAAGVTVKPTHQGKTGINPAEAMTALERKIKRGLTSVFAD